MMDPKEFTNMFVFDIVNDSKMMLFGYPAPEICFALCLLKSKNTMQNHALENNRTIAKTVPKMSGCFC